jgi:hypothetical protein
MVNQKTFFGNTRDNKIRPSTSCERKNAFGSSLPLHNYNFDMAPILDISWQEVSPWRE